MIVFGSKNIHLLEINSNGINENAGNWWSNTVEVLLN